MRTLLTLAILGLTASSSFAQQASMPTIVSGDSNPTGQAAPAPAAVAPMPGQSRGAVTPAPTPNQTAPTAPAQGRGGRGQVAQGGQQPAPPAAARPNVLGPMLDVPANVRLELVITDTYTSPSAKTVTMLIQNGSNGMIRANAGPGANLYVDASLTAYQNNRIAVRLSFDYTPAARPNNERQPGPLQESISVLLEEGKALLVSQSADAASDRKVSVELKATIIK